MISRIELKRIMERRRQYSESVRAEIAHTYAKGEALRRIVRSRSRGPGCTTPLIELMRRNRHHSTT